MTIATVVVVDASNPVELQAWLDQHPNASIFDIRGNNTIFYIFYS